MALTFYGLNISLAAVTLSKIFNPEAFVFRPESPTWSKTKTQS